LKPFSAVFAGAERFICGVTTTAERDYFTLRNRVVFAIFVGDRDRAYKAKRTVLSNLNIDSCHRPASKMN